MKRDCCAKMEKKTGCVQKRQVRLLNIREIARQAGLSIATISRVINHPETVAPETRERVLGILESCNYSPKLAAKPPRKKTGAVVLIVPVLPRYYGILAGIRQVLQANGYQLTICETSGFRGGENGSIRAVAASRPDGVILVRGSEAPPELGPLRQAGIPVVLIGKCADAESENNCSINFQDAAAKLTAHLIDMKYTRIALVQTEADYPEKPQITAGFLQALAAGGLDAGGCPILETEDSVRGGYIVLKEMLAEGEALPQAFFAADDGIAVGIMKAAQEEKLAVPRQLAVAGFTDSEMATVVCPALTTVEHPYERLGTVAARRLIDLIENSELYDIETQEIVLKSKLKIRKSCGNKKNIYEQFE